tara:strand:- start:5660 stop:5857 length:198 start_codon:yes stop_codon:yes gene_type:complete
MKVKELIEKLKKINPEMDVFCTSNTGEYEYGIVSTAKTSFIRLNEDVRDFDKEDEETLVFIISEE